MVGDICAYRCQCGFRDTQEVPVVDGRDTKRVIGNLDLGSGFHVFVMDPHPRFAVGSSDGAPFERALDGFTRGFDAVVSDTVSWVDSHTNIGFVLVGLSETGQPSGLLLETGITTDSLATGGRADSVNVTDIDFLIHMKHLEIQFLQRWFEAYKDSLEVMGYTFDPETREMIGEPLDVDGEQLARSHAILEGLFVIQITQANNRPDLDRVGDLNRFNLVRYDSIWDRETRELYPDYRPLIDQQINPGALDNLAHRSGFMQEISFATAFQAGAGTELSPEENYNNTRLVIDWAIHSADQFIRAANRYKQNLRDGTVTEQWIVTPGDGGSIPAPRGVESPASRNPGVRVVEQRDRER